MNQDRVRVLRGESRGLTAALLLTVTTFAFEALGVATAMPKVVEELGGLWLYGWAFSALTLGHIVGLGVAGTWVDRAGPASPFSTGLTVFAAGLVIGGFAPTMPILVVGRAIQGFGAGAVVSANLASLGRAYDENERARLVALMSTAWVVPGIVGPGISGFVAEHVTWRAVFLGVLPVLVVALALGLPAMRALGAPATSDMRVASSLAPSLRVAGGATLLIAGLGARSLLAFPLLAIGVVLGLPALARMLPPGTLTGARGLPATISTRGLLTFAFFGAEAFLTLALTSVRGQSASAAGLALTFATLSWTAGAWIQERRGARWGLHRLIASGFALLIAGIGGLALVLSPDIPVVVAALAWLVAGLGMGLAFSSGTLLTLAAAPKGAEGTTSAGLQLADVLGVALGAGLGGAAVALSDSAGWPLSTGLLLAFVPCIAAAIVGLAIASRRLSGTPRQV